MNDDNEPPLKVIYSLWLRKPLRQQAEAVLLDPQTSIESLELIFRAFHHRSLLRRKERMVASWLLLHANYSDDQRGMISDTLSKSIDKAMQASKPSRVALRWFCRGMILSLLFWIGYAYVLVPGSYNYEGIVDFWFGMLIISAVLTVLGAVVSAPLSIWFDNYKLRGLRPLIEVLGQQGKSGSIGSLATAAVHPSLCEVAIPALASVTSRLQPEDYGTLPMQTVPALCYALTKGDSPVVLVSLHALRVVGDGRAIRAVEQVAAWKLRPEIVEAATQLLPILQQRATESQASSQLLRASSATGEGEHTLLRASYALSVTAPSELLRAATSEQDEQSA